MDQPSYTRNLVWMSHPRIQSNCQKNRDWQICVNRVIYVYISPSVLRSSMSIGHRSHFLPVLTSCTSCISADNYWFNWRKMICTNGYWCCWRMLHVQMVTEKYYMCKWLLMLLKNIYITNGYWYCWRILHVQMVTDGAHTNDMCKWLLKITAHNDMLKWLLTSPKWWMCDDGHRQYWLVALRLVIFIYFNNIW
jgi:hypothetical protein